MIKQTRSRYINEAFFGNAFLRHYFCISFKLLSISIVLINKYLFSFSQYRSYQFIMYLLPKLSLFFKLCDKILKGYFLLFWILNCERNFIVLITCKILKIICVCINFLNKKQVSLNCETINFEILILICGESKLKSWFKSNPVKFPICNSR